MSKYVKHKNRYGDEYWWEKIDDNTLKFNMTGDSLKYGRYGGKPYQDKLDMNDLGMFDPSGGPYISIGSVVEKKIVTKISIINDEIFVRVKDNV